MTDDEANMSDSDVHRPEGDDLKKDAVLNQYAFYVEADESFRTTLRDAAHYIAADHEQPMMQAGRACEAALFVGKGRVRVFIEGESGRVANLYHVHAGELCPINIGACLRRKGAFANAVADGPVEAVIIPSERFDEMRADNERIQELLFDATAERYGEVVALLRDVITLSVDQRLAVYLLENTQNDGNVRRSVNVTHANLAMDIGTAREVINRRLKTLESSGVLALSRGSIEIRDRHALESIRDGTG